jgi:hypothetical protein
LGECTRKSRRWQVLLEYRAVFLEGRPVDIMLPPTVTLEVADTAAPIRGGSDATWKFGILCENSLITG